MGNRLLYKISYFLLIVTLFLTLFHYSVANSESFSVGDFLDNPALYAGEKKSIKGIYAGSFSEGFLLVKNHHLVKVYSSHHYEPPKYGEVLVYGTLQRDRSILAEGVHNYDYAYFTIYGGSFLAGLLVIIYFFKEWKITRRGLQSA